MEREEDRARRHGLQRSGDAAGSGAVPGRSTYTGQLEAGGNGPYRGTAFTAAAVQRYADPGAGDRSAQAGDRGGSRDRTGGGSRDRTGGGSRDGTDGGTRPPQLATNLEQFTIDFNREFAAELHVFTDDAQAPAERGPDVASSADAAAIASGDDVSQERLMDLFTPAQIDALAAFCRDHVIPERLFNGDDIGNTTAQQRILLSGHILTVGHYAPGAFDQRVHARMCGHWVNLVYSYAGVGEGLGAGVREQFDHTGGLVMSVEDRTDAAGRETTARGTRDSLDRDLGLGARHASAPGARSQWELQGLPIAQYAAIQPGDWLWIYNDNGPGGGNHSVVFSRWASDPLEHDGVRYRRAVTMSQPSPDGGGHEELRALGERFVSLGEGRGHITPVTHVSHPDPSARPMQTVEDLVAILGSGTEAQANFRFVQRVTRGRGAFDWAALAQYLREQNDALITQLAPHMTENQLHVFRATNELHPPAGEESVSAEGEIGLLVRLHQRLRILVSDAGSLDAGAQAQRDRVGRTHDATLEESRAERDQLAAQIAQLEVETRQLEDEQAPIDAQVEQYAEHTGALHDLLVERRRLRARRQELRTSLRTTSHTPEQVSSISEELRSIGDRLAELQPAIAQQQAEETATRSDRRAAQRADRQGDVRIHQHTMQIARLQERIARLEASAGYVTAHGGVARDAFQGRGQARAVTGLLSQLEPPPNWRSFLRAAASTEEPPIIVTLQ